MSAVPYAADVAVERIRERDGRSGVRGGDRDDIVHARYGDVVVKRGRIAPFEGRAA